MKKKTEKTPLMTASAFGLTSCTPGLAFESELSRSPEAQYGFVSKLSHHGGKTPLTLKNQFGFASACGFYCFSSDDVSSCAATGDAVRAGAGACSQAQSHDGSTKARSAMTSTEGFSRFLFITET